MARRFEIYGTITRQYSRFNAVGSQVTVHLFLPSNNVDPVNHFLASLDELFEHKLQNVSDSDMVGMTIHNQVNQSDKPNGISFSRKDQLSGDVIWSVFEKLSQSNSRFNALDTLVVNVHSVKMPVGFESVAIKTMGRPISVVTHLKKTITEIKATAHALIIAIAGIEHDSNYESYRKVWKISPVVRFLLEKKGIDLSSGGGIPELARFQEQFREYKIVVYQGLSCDNIIFEGRVESAKRLNLLYNDVEKHYHVITNLRSAMARRYVCKACNKS